MRCDGLVSRRQMTVITDTEPSAPKGGASVSLESTPGKLKPLAFAAFSSYFASHEN